MKVRLFLFGPGPKRASQPGRRHAAQAEEIFDII